jgi:hypothetical protein
VVGILIAAQARRKGAALSRGIAFFSPDQTTKRAADGPPVWKKNYGSAGEDAALRASG